MLSDQEASEALLEVGCALARSNWAVEESIGGFSQALDRLASILTVVLQGANMVEVTAKTDAIDLVNVHERLGKLEVSVARQEVVLDFIKDAISKLPKADAIAELRAVSAGHTKGQTRATDMVLDIVKWLIIAVLMYVWTQVK